MSGGQYCPVRGHGKGNERGKGIKSWAEIYFSGADFGLRFSSGWHCVHLLMDAA
jgi:hypothetical protein